MDFSSAPPKKVKEGFPGQRMMVLPPDIRRNMHNNPLTKGLFLTAIGYYPHALHHDIERPQGSPEYIFIYCAEGKGEIITGNSKKELTPNSFIIIPPSVPHHYRSSEAEPWSIYWVHFHGTLAGALYARFTDNPEEPEVTAIPFDEKKLDLFNRIISLSENSFEERNMEVVQFHLLHFLSSIIYHPETDPSNYAEDKVTRSVDFMKRNLQSPLTLEQLAANESLSVSRYCELFKLKTGFSPIQYFIHLKIQKSCQYLYFTDMSVKEICRIVGFEDPFYFSRIFKKTMGVSPSKYKSMDKFR